MAVLAQSLKNAINLHRAGKFTEAERIYAWVAEQSPTPPNKAETLHLLALCRASAGRHDQAADTLRQAAAADPQNPTFPDALGQMLLRGGRFREAADAYRDVLRLAPHALPAYINLGNALLNAGDHLAATEALQTVLRTDPNHAAALTSLAFIAERLCDFPRARAHAEHAATLNPADPEVNILLARIERRLDRHADAQSRMERLIPSCQNARDFGRAAIELALALDALGDCRRAFEAFSQGKKGLFSLTDPRSRDLAAPLAVLDSTRRALADVRPPAAHTDDGVHDPVFLLGFPASGVSLLAQMLSAHPRFAAAEDAPLLQRTRAAIPAIAAPSRPYPDALADLTPAHISALRRRHADEARAHLGAAADGRRIVERLGVTLADLPLARILFPRAPIIALRRDPRDACFLAFFSDADRPVPHFYDLGWTAQYADAFFGAWFAVRDSVAMPVHDVRYEDLVSAPEKTLRAVLAAVAEPWDAAVLASHEPAHRRFIANASYADVARPPFTTTVGAWRRYEPELEPSTPGLMTLAQSLGYEP